jgi:hypothetical protein
VKSTRIGCASADDLAFLARIRCVDQNAAGRRHEAPADRSGSETGNGLRLTLLGSVAVNVSLTMSLQSRANAVVPANRAGSRKKKPVTPAGFFAGCL